MDKEGDIDKLLEKMREENLQYREGKHLKVEENDEDEEEMVIEARYNGKNKCKENLDREKGNKGKKVKKVGKMERKIDENKDPVRVAKSPSAQKKKVKKGPKRPATAKSLRKDLASTTGAKKLDKLTLFLSRQDEWKSVDFLRSNTLDTREGRKLNLIARLKKKPFELKKKREAINSKNDYIPIHLKRRDELRFTTRLKMLSF